MPEREWHGSVSDEELAMIWAKVIEALRLAYCRGWMWVMYSLSIRSDLGKTIACYGGAGVLKVLLDLRGTIASMSVLRLTIARFCFHLECHASVRG